MSTTPELDHTVATDSEDGLLRVGAGSNPQMLAAAIAHAIYDNRQVDIRAIGAGAVNQAVKAVAIARGYAAPRGFNLACSPGFATVKATDGSGQDITAMVLHVFVI